VKKKFPHSFIDIPVLLCYNDKKKNERRKAFFRVPPNFYGDALLADLKKGESNVKDDI